MHHPPPCLAALSLLAASILPASAADPAPTIPALPVPERVDAIVSRDGGSSFKTLQEAIDAAPEHATEPHVILIKPGLYRWQQTHIPRDKPYIHLVGEDVETTTLSYHLNVHEVPKERPLKGREGTTLIVDSDHFSARNLTIENSSGDRGQGLALRLDGDRTEVRNCRLLGWQDTLMVNSGRQHFRDCYIEGRVDFIFGSATAVFEHCEIRSKNGGYVTAASTPEERSFGLVFLDCRLTSDPTPWDPIDGRPGDAAYLGRPWRPHAQVAFVRCELGAHIRPEGWHNWSRPDNERTARYYEYRNTGPGAGRDARIAWSRELGDDEARAYTAAHILQLDDR